MRRSAKQRLHALDPTISIQKEIERGLAAVTVLLEEHTLVEGSKKDNRSIITELELALRALTWDIDDLEYTLDVIEEHPRRFVLTRDDLLVRRAFASSTRHFVEDISTTVGAEAAKPSIGMSSTAGGGYRYSRLEQDDDNNFGGELGLGGGGPSSSSNVSDLLMKQDRILRQQDDDLELVGQSMGTLKAMSSRIGAELEQQSVMLDELGEDMDRVDSKLDGVMKKIAKLTNLEDDSRQCRAILILSILVFFLLFLLIVL